MTDNEKSSTHMLTVAVANQKGGVGKSSVVLGLASAAAQRDIPTLVVDMDPQANTSVALGPQLGTASFTVNDVLYADRRGSAAEAIQVSTWSPTVALIPASLELAERDTDTRLGSEHRLAKALDDPELRKGFQLCLVDCPPSLGRLVSNALIAADRLLVVTEPSYPASQGVANIMQTLETIREHYNPRLQLAGVIVNKVPARGREAAHRVQELTQHLDDGVIWHPLLPQRAVIAEAMGAGVGIHQLGARSRTVSEIFAAYLMQLLTEPATERSPQ